jgi:hypothetical protein
MQTDTDPTNAQEAVQRRAYELYEQRGREDGHDFDDWLAAERELRGSAVVQRTEVATEVAPAKARPRRADDRGSVDRGVTHV